MEHEPDWSARLTKMIGTRVAFYRARATSGTGRKLTAQGLADRCTELGLPTDRPAIAKLEVGLRKTLTIAELLVLAKALDVPPFALLFPVGYVADVPVLPGREAGPRAAADWFIGSSGDPANSDVPSPMGLNDPMALWDEHARYEREIENQEGFSFTPAAPGATDPIERLRLTLASSLRRCRQAMRDIGMTPPVLRPVAARLIGEEEQIDG